MPRSSHIGELKFDPEIEKTARRLRWEIKQHTEEASISYEDGRDITLEFEESSGENRHKHLKEFHVVCFGMRPQGIIEEQVKLRAFPFSLADQTKDWLYFLPSGSITTWNDLKRQFLEKYFPASRATTICKEINGIR
ncbi:UNVERIFIED_CONTAM: hypothetical protein Scaly_2536100 [Sesamum calycinum]|uniref:Retrotransposon gag domain-containing protein n=1 Tax=Sesamum calycinum TaxID=2727403 RepID=A0AAW2LSX7_9LAMI